MQVIRHSGVTLHVRDDGPKDGRTLVFANSLGTDLRVWDDLIARLPPTYRIVRFDKRGHGLSDTVPAPYAMADLMADAAAVCDGLRLCDVTFIGLSIGGMIGQMLSATRPDLIKALVLMDTAAKIGTPEMWTTRIATIRAEGIKALEGAIMDRWFTPPFRADNPTYPLWCNMLTRTPVDGYIGCCAAIADADLTDTTRALDLPVLAMVGDQDGSTPPDLVRATAALCGAEFHLIPGAGHIPCVEQPDATATLLIDFLERTAR